MVDIINTTEKGLLIRQKYWEEYKRINQKVI